ncbi:multimerin-2 [Magallana gigas]|uniref:multimerin-2 n=1 Tax=Magallana gigas TaxID=29159 RepID=UPI00333F4A7B
METLKTTVFIVVLFHIALDVYGLSSDDTCIERLDNLEKLLANLNEKLENHQAKKTKDDAMFKDIQDENSNLRRRMKSLEEIVLTSSRRTEKLEARIADLESSNWFLKSRMTSANTNFRFNKKYSNSLLGNLRTDDLSKENTTTDPPTNHGNKEKLQLQTASVKRKISQSEKIPRASKEKRILTGIQSTSTPFPDGAAFSAYVSHYETDISKEFTIHFDTVLTNIGNHYNKHSGTFTAPQHGVYVFTWNLYCYAEGYIYSQLVVNSNVVGTMFTSAQGAANIRSPTGIVVVEVNQGDVVFVRTHPTNGHVGNLYSYTDYRSSFNGWKLY